MPELSEENRAKTLPILEEFEPRSSSSLGTIRARLSNKAVHRKTAGIR
jgi:hypothetical protein